MNRQSKGKVIFAGAGPGDPDLITIKAAQALQRADIVLTDRLVSEDILTKYVNAEAEIIYVGKQAGSEMSTSQKSINELIAECATRGKLIVRLKGGDVSVFSNIMDELETVLQNNIPYEIIPGITAASGAAAYTGIPLTARGYSTAARFLTYYKSDIIKDEYWKELAATDDTLIFYMSSETIDIIVQKLTANDISSDKLMAVVEQATTPFQNVQVSSLYDFNKNIQKQFISPSLLIIGKVAALYNQFKWIENSKRREYYFKPVEEVTGSIKLSA